MRQELAELLASYLLGQTTLSKCYEWISGIAWDDSEFRNDSDLMSTIGRLELFSIEFLESMRPESEFRQAAREFLVEQGLVEELLWFDVDEALSGLAPEGIAVSSTQEDIIAVQVA